MSDTTSRDALQRSIASRLPLLSHDELRVFDVQLERMLKIGRENYGPLMLSSEQRDWRSEASDEFSDALFYLCAQYVARQDRRKERLRCFIADEDFKRVDSGLDEIVLATQGVACTDCRGTAGEHRSDCPWVVQIPPSEAAL